MGEWIRFFITAALLILGIVSFVMEVTGLIRFKFVMDRMHAAGIGDTMGAFCVILALMVSSGLNMTTLKLFLVIVFLWLMSPTSTHFLAVTEVDTNRDIAKHVKLTGMSGELAERDRAAGPEAGRGAG